MKTVRVAAVMAGWAIAAPVLAADMHMGMDGHGHAAMAGMDAPGSWTTYPTLKPMMNRASGEAGMVTIVPRHIVSPAIDVYSSRLRDAERHRTLPAGLGGSTLKLSMSGGFNWLTAREEGGGMVRVASTAYFSSERGAKDPTAMFMLRKNELEIIPQPYPREHSSYRADEEWKFMVRFDGNPLPGHSVYLETSNGSTAEFVSDAQGMYSVRIPNDFRADVRTVSGHNRRSAELVLGTEYEDDGKTYLTAFNSSYGPDAFDNRSLRLGLGFTVLGMIGALPMLRNRKSAGATREPHHA